MKSLLLSLRLLACLVIVALCVRAQAADFKRHSFGGGGIGAVTGVAPGFSTATVLDANTEKVGWCFSTDEAVTITRLGFRYGARAATPPTYRISIQTCDPSTGNPDGTPLGGGSPASATFTPPADTTWDGTWRWVTLSNSYAATRGQVLAIVVDYSSGTIDGTNNSSFTVRGTGLSGNLAFPYALVDTTGSWAKQSANTPIFGYSSASVTYGVPLEAVTLTQYHANSTPDEFALKFTVPAASCATFQVVAARCLIRAGVAGTTVVATLYEGTTSRQTATWDTDLVSTTSASDLTLEVNFDESSLSDLPCGTAHYVGFAPSATSNSFALRTYDMDSNADLAPFPGGSDFHLATRTDAGSWTEDSSVNFRRPVCELIIKDVTEPSGDSGVKRVIGS